MLESVRIILLAVVAAVVYGIAHDQVTARVCVEYFTIGHPPVFPTESPTLLAFGWGVIATWWVGVLLGVPAALLARCGSRPKLTAQDLVKPIAWLLLVMGCASLLAGAAGYFTARNGAVWLLEPLASRVPRPKHVAFITDLWAHSAAYAVGFLGGWVLWWRIWRRRYLLATDG